MALKVSLTKLLQDPNRAPDIDISINEEVSILMAEEKMDVNGIFLKDKRKSVTLSQSRDLSNIQQ